MPDELDVSEARTDRFEGCMVKSAVQLHWDYFLLLEKDLITIGETLELSEANYSAYGPRLVQLILSSGSELDVALKSLALAMCPEHAALLKSSQTCATTKICLSNMRVSNSLLHA